MPEPGTGPASWGVETTREASEARFQKLFDEADAMSIQGYLPDGTVVYWNRASERIYGYTAVEAMGRSLLDLIIPPEMRQDVEGAIRWMFETGQAIPSARLNLRHKDGRTVPVFSSHTIVRVPGHTPVLFCMDADMTDLAKAEDELRLAAAAFNSQQGMIVTDASGVILRVNYAFTQATGFSAGDAVGNTPRILKSDRHPDSFHTAVWQSLLEHGEWEGEVWNRRKDGSVYPNWVTITAVRDSGGRVTHYVGTQGDITQRKEAEAKVLQLAFYDSLTGLPNRRLLRDRLQQAIAAGLRNGACGALLFIDLDNFKTLNDTLGHDTGDILLQQVSGRLLACTRKKDTAARLGGDEFVVMMEDLSGKLQEAAAQAGAAGRKILDELGRHYRLGQHGYVGSVSIGITLFSEQQATVDDLMRQADLAMYEAKAGGRNGLRFFDPDMQATVNLHAALERGIRDGLERKEFQLYFQPQVDREGAIVGAEALLRWERPGLGLVLPGEFVAVAEESGLIQPLGAWVMDAACTELARWARDPRTAGLNLGVNVSARQFRNSDFVEQVLASLRKAGANPRRLKLELTENLLVEKVDEVIAKMTVLRDHGVGFSLDDFGTGYSSLAYLRRMPLEQLKIDLSFIRDIMLDPHSAAIAETVIVLGRTMALSVIAEGVETEAQREWLAQRGCDAYQGYLFGRPMPAQDLLVLLESTRGSAG